LSEYRRLHLRFHRVTSSAAIDARRVVATPVCAAARGLVLSRDVERALVFIEFGFII
jgi:hypothetical protein